MHAKPLGLMTAAATYMHIYALCWKALHYVKVVEDKIHTASKKNLPVAQTI